MPNPHDKSPTQGFDRGYGAIGALLLGLLFLSIKSQSAGLIALVLLTVMLWVSVGAAMLISRFNQGRWE
ncbi:hypothetical protein TPY_1035 [Sulfobacillus acidophilus TPY]|uniref:Uncharacterized protein n=1 Tax=Sulfobacillus acidophilus (strain ATCC 700253 / DSM 10332 / NAL) TaxID=679936 RepID=G8TX73_SULAD|nr:hypothetical protein TPY_1035 [Sulfobacillus acidophilus TPY]AEW06075.1 hypothetical protein Sulac_2613 [Sulfobacillus acidophilus DSM 10332]